MLVTFRQELTCADNLGKRLVPVAFDVVYGPDGLPANFPPKHLAILLAEFMSRILVSESNQ